MGAILSLGPKRPVAPTRRLRSLAHWRRRLGRLLLLAPALAVAVFDVAERNDLGPGTCGNLAQLAPGAFGRLPGQQ
jgi:hypothetical protein